ncbi:hypothetical protein TWF696_005558 [Orbilia brochopaga]|uniref:DUF8004 domain-containing protein n=1 Tax=Orbilia brochopaga TaxID=3140254 RepID=A0AAV9V214_9PEZI
MATTASENAGSSSGPPMPSIFNSDAQEGGGPDQTDEELALAEEFRISKGLPKAYKIRSGQDLETCPPYNYYNLYNGHTVEELWDSKGDTLVYLSAKGDKDPTPSFCVQSSTLLGISGYWLAALSRDSWQAGFKIDRDKYPAASLALFFAPGEPTRPGRNKEPNALDLLRHYVTIRNVFACIFGVSCVDLHEDDSAYPLFSDFVDRIFMYCHGAGADSKFSETLSAFLEQSGLCDVRNDPVKAVALLRLADAFELKTFYHEAFSHCVGMWPQVRKCEENLSKPLARLVDDRYKCLMAKVDDVVIAIKAFQFKAFWKIKPPFFRDQPRDILQGCNEMGSFLSKYYSQTMSRRWPPKTIASRTVLGKVYADAIALYLLLADTRTARYSTTLGPATDSGLTRYEHLLYGFDRTVSKRGNYLTYGLPIFPDFSRQNNPVPALLLVPQPQPPPSGLGIPNDYADRVLNEDQLNQILSKLYNDDGMRGMDGGDDGNSSEAIRTAFMGFEKDLMKRKAKTPRGIADFRKGIWMMVYFLISMMEEVCVDEAVLFRDGVEYFLSADTKGICLWENTDDLTPARR